MIVLFLILNLFFLKSVNPNLNFFEHFNSTYNYTYVTLSIEWTSTLKHVIVSS